jgi:hypothetical protein
LYLVGRQKVNYRLIYSGLIIVGVLFVAIGMKHELYGIAAVGGIMVGGFSVSLRFLNRRPEQRKLSLAPHDAQPESAIRAVRQLTPVSHPRFRDSMGGGLDDSEYP